MRHLFARKFLARIANRMLVTRIKWAGRPEEIGVFARPPEGKRRQLEGQNSGCESSMKSSGSGLFGRARLVLRRAEHGFEYYEG